MVVSVCSIYAIVGMRESIHLMNLFHLSDWSGLGCIVTSCIKLAPLSLMSVTKSIPLISPVAMWDHFADTSCHECLHYLGTGISSTQSGINAIQIQWRKRKMTFNYDTCKVYEMVILLHPLINKYLLKDIVDRTMNSLHRPCQTLCLCKNRISRRKIMAHFFLRQ